MDVIDSPGVPPLCRIVNVVGTFQLGVGINLRLLAVEYKDVLPVKFNQEKFAAATLNFEAEGVGQMTALIFSTGNVVLTGAICEDQSRYAAHQLARSLNERLGIPASVVKFKMRNIVSSLNLGFPVDLYAMKEGLGDRVEFDPPKFPAAIMRGPFDEKEVILVYDTGGVVLTGCKQRHNIRKNHISIYQTALLYRGTRKATSFEKHSYRLKGRNRFNDEAGLKKLKKLLDKGTKRASSKNDVLYKRLVSVNAPLQLTPSDLPFTPLHSTPSRVAL